MTVPTTSSGADRDVAAREVSVILVTYNSGAALRECLSSLAGKLDPAEVIVVDNGSQDDTVAIASNHPATRVIRGHGNVGFGSAVNIGAAAASSDLLLVLNPDTILVDVGHAELGRLSATKATGLLACRQVGAGLGQHPVFPAWGWRAELYWWMFAWFLLPRELPQPRPRPRRSQARWINGSAFVARREEFLAAGGFDEDFFLYFEDFDLSRTYRLRGLPVGETSAFAVTHAGAQSSPRDNERMIAYALLGLIESAAKSGDGQAAAARSLALLRWIANAGGLLAGLPLLGPRARAKGTSAETVLGLLEREGDGEPAAGRYRRARQAVQAVRCR